MNFLLQDMADAKGMPVGVQCAARQFNEELVLRVMKDVEIGIKMI